MIISLQCTILWSVKHHHHHHHHPNKYHTHRIPYRIQTHSNDVQVGFFHWNSKKRKKFLNHDHERISFMKIISEKFLKISGINGVKRQHWQTNTEKIISVSSLSSFLFIVGSVIHSFFYSDNICVFYMVHQIWFFFTWCLSFMIIFSLVFVDVHVIFGIWCFADIFFLSFYLVVLTYLTLTHLYNWLFIMKYMNIFFQ